MRLYGISISFIVWVKWQSKIENKKNPLCQGEKQQRAKIMFRQENTKNHFKSLSYTLVAAYRYHLNDL